MKLSGYNWVTYSNLSRALDRIRTGKIDGVDVALSKNYYVLDPFDWTAWDLKVVVKVASVIEANAHANFEAITSYDFSPGNFPRKIQRVGLAVLRFDVGRERKLGLNSVFDVSEYEDPHVVYWPGAQDQKNALRPSKSQQVAVNGGPPPMVQVTSSRFLRNPTLVKAILAQAKGKCQNCGQRSFKTPDGDWFLEAHHKRWLSDGGPDILENLIALCPNCHRQEHYGATRKYN